MHLIYLYFVILFTSKGYAQHLPRYIKDGLEETRTFNIKFMADFIYFARMAYPCKNTIVMSVDSNYVIGYLSEYAKCKKDTQKILKAFNYESTEQVKGVLPKVSSQIFAFNETYASWSGTIFADLSMEFKREFIDNLFKYYCNTVRNSDFKNPELTACIINYMVQARAGGFSNNGQFIYPEMIVNDGRFLIIGTGYLEGSLLDCVSARDTSNRRFQLPSGRTKQLPTMRIQGNHRYGIMKKFDAEILEMEFTARQFYIRIIKPKNTHDINDILQELRNPRRYDKIFSNLEELETNVYMPRVNVHQHYDLLKQMNQSGIKIDFRSLEYNGIFDNASQAYLSDAIIDIRLRINEGTNLNNYTDSCPKYNKWFQTVNINSTFIYFINTMEGGIPLLGGVYTGEN